MSPSYSIYRLLPAYILFLLSSLLPDLAVAQQPPTFDMAVRVLAPAVVPGGRPYTNDIAVDAAGNSYISGTYGGPVRFGSTTIGAGVGDMYIAKIGVNGQYRWIVPIATGQGGNSIYFTKLAVDTGGNVCVVGRFTSPTLRLGATTLVNRGGSDVFVAWLDPNGNWLSAVQGGGTGNESCTSLRLDASGHVYIMGHFNGTSTFGTTTLTSAGYNDIFAARLDANGTWRWAVRGGGSDDRDWAYDIGVDARGHAYITSRSGFLGGQYGAFAVPASTMFVAQLDAATGAFQRITSVGGVGNPNLHIIFCHLAVNAAGDCYLAGSFVGQITFGSAVFNTGGLGVSTDDVFVAKLSASGVWQWANTATGTFGEVCSDIALDAQGNTYVAGTFRGVGTRFGSVTLVAQNVSLLPDDAFVAKLDANGAWLWAVPVGGIYNEINTRLALGPGDTPYIAGEHVSPLLQFGPLTVPGDPVRAISTYVARMQPNTLAITGDSIACTGGVAQLTASAFATSVSWQWSTGATTPSVTVTQPGVYTVQAFFAGGYSLSQQFRVQSIAAPTVQITGAGGYLCPGMPRQLTALAPGAVAVRWSTGETTPSITITQPGTYTVVATYGPGCTATAQATVAGNALGITGRLQLCPGQSTTLTAAATGTAVTGYRWDTGATTAALVVGQAGTYRVTATMADGCQLTATHTVGPPVAQVASVSGDTLLCPGTSLTLTALNPDALTYRWNTGATTPTITIVQPGHYGVVLTYAGGCSSRDSLRVWPAPEAPLFTLGQDTTLCLEQPLLLYAPAFSAGVSWRWSDGSTGPTLRVNEAGTYSLMVSTRCGTRTSSRRVAYKSCLFIPNVITPNNDQLNDWFVVQGLPGGDWALTIYNRWGRQVYQTSVYHHDWGADALPGHYYYLLRQATTSTVYKGLVEVIR